MSTKTLSIRMNDEDYHFLSTLAREEREDVSKKVRELVDLGRIMLAIEMSARIAGVSISKMIEIFKRYGVEVNLELTIQISNILQSSKKDLILTGLE